MPDRMDKMARQVDQIAQKQRWMNRIFLWIFLILIIAVVILSILLHFARKGESKPEITASSLKEQLVEVEDLTTVQYHYTTVGSFEDQKDFHGLQLPFTRKKFIISYDGTIHAGIDLKAMEIDIHDKTVDIRLPQPQILAHAIDEDSMKVFEESDTIFNQMSVEDLSSFEQTLKERKEAEALQEGLLKKAGENGKASLTRLLEMNPDIKGQYAIHISMKEEASSLPSASEASSPEGGSSTSGER